MSEEEQEIIEKIIDRCDNCKFATCENCEINWTQVQAIFNLQKENEKIEMKLLEKDLHIDGLKEDRKIAIEEIQEQYFVSKDKIKDKIKELEEIMKAICEKEDVDDYQCEEYYKIEVLEELLKE